MKNVKINNKAQLLAGSLLILESLISTIGRNYFESASEIRLPLAILCGIVGGLSCYNAIDIVEDDENSEQS